MANLHVTWDSGRGEMNLDLDLFLPVAKKHFNGILDNVDLDLEHRDEHHLFLEEYISERISAIEESTKDVKRKYLDVRQELADVSAMVESGRHPNGVPLSKSEIITMSYKRESLIKSAKKTLSDFNKVEALIKKYKGLLDVLQRRG